MVLILQQAATVPDTIVALTMPAERTWFDYVSGTLQLLVLLLGAVALFAIAGSALAMRAGIQSLQKTIDRLMLDTKPLVDQAVRATEDARDIVKVVRSEVGKLAEATSSLGDRLQDLSDSAEERLDRVNAVLDVVQTQVEKSAIGAISTSRGLKVGASALGAALLFGRKRAAGNADEDDEFDDDPDTDDEDDLDDDHDDDDFYDGDEPVSLDPADRPYFPDPIDDDAAVTRRDVEAT